MGKADEAAKVLCFLLSDDASYVTGGMLALHILIFPEAAEKNELLTMSRTLDRGWWLQCLLIMQLVWCDLIVVMSLNTENG